jgi:hypothetical protein
MTNMMVYFGGDARRSCSERNVGGIVPGLSHVAARDAILERDGYGLLTPTATTRTPTKCTEETATGIHSFKRRARLPQRHPFSLPLSYNVQRVRRPQIPPDYFARLALPRKPRLFILSKPTESVMSLAINTNRPLVSSPLASPISPSRQPSRPLSIKNPLFPASRPLRPFPSIMTATVNGARGATKKPVKIIEPPKGYSGGCFVLNLTQAELSRRD